jgi:hypothetical protein
MVLVFVPVPYVDASSSAAFRSKWQRATVSAAGIIVEGALAAIALFIWLSFEPGFVRAFAYNVMLIGSISTLVFNGNPLLKFDGYYVLSDLLEIPNLGSRANKYVTYLIQRYAFGIGGIASPATARGEAPWLFSYAVAATLYRLSILLTIALYIAGKLFFVGIALSIASVASTVVWPLVRAMRFVADSPQLYRRRRRAIVTTFAAAAAALALFLAIPLPFSTIAQGVVWVGDQAAVHAQTDGFIAAVAVDNGTLVEPGTTLIKGEDSELVQQTDVIEKHLDIAAALRCGAAKGHRAGQHPARAGPPHPGPARSFPPASRGPQPQGRQSGAIPCRRTGGPARPLPAQGRYRRLCRRRGRPDRARAGLAGRRRPRPAQHADRRGPHRRPHGPAVEGDRAARGAVGDLGYPASGPDHDRRRPRAARSVQGQRPSEAAVPVRPARRWGPRQVAARRPGLCALPASAGADRLPDRARRAP